MMSTGAETLKTQRDDKCTECSDFSIFKCMVREGSTLLCLVAGKKSKWLLSCQ